MDAFIAFILGVVAGIVLYLAVRVLRRINSHQEKENDMRRRQAIEKFSEMFIPLHVRMMDDVLYAYNADDGSFVASGTDLGTLKVNFLSMYKDKKGVVVSSDENCASVFNDEVARTMAGIRMVYVNGEMKND